MKKISSLAIIAALALSLSACSEEGAAPASTDEAAVQTTDAAAEPAAEEKADDVPTEHKSALKSAENYSKTMHMSKAGIYDQLTSEFDQFSKEAAQYAVDNMEADWNQNALESAKSYQETMSMSPAAIRDQLVSEFDQFTPEQADYAVANLD